MSDIKKTYEVVVRDVLERFAFVFLDDPGDSEGSVNYNSYVHVTITFRGSVSGAICLAAPAELCSTLAMNIMGVEASELTADSPNDAMKEIANIICGEFVVAIYGNKEVFDLTVPVATDICHGKWQEMVADKEAFLLNVDGLPLLATVCIIDV